MVTAVVHGRVDIKLIGPVDAYLAAGPISAATAFPGATILLPTGGTTTITNGIQLDATNCGIQPYLAAGGTLTASGSIVAQPGATYTGLDITGKVSAASAFTTPAVFKNCRITASGIYAVDNTNHGNLQLQNCTIIGGTTATIWSANVTLTDCEVTGGVDLLRPASNCTFTRVWAHDPQRQGAGAHSDAFQLTTNGASLTNITLSFCKLDAYGFDNYSNKMDWHNSAIQMGSFSGGSVTNFNITDCYFNGGNFTVNAGGLANVGGYYRRNQFGLDSNYGPLQAITYVDFDSSNVWAVSGTYTIHNSDGTVKTTFQTVAGQPVPPPGSGLGY